MKKIFALVLPLTVALAASLGCVSANAAQAAHKAPVAESASQAAQTTHSLPRREAHDLLVKAEKDSSPASPDTTVYFGA
jgi:hypothetical protein